MPQKKQPTSELEWTGATSEPTLTASDVKVQSLGKPKIPSPLTSGRFIPEDAAILVHCDSQKLNAHEPITLEEAGPRQKIYFDPAKTKVAIVTCGGLCPGINDVIRSIVLGAHYDYGVAAVIGIRYGLEGFVPKYGHDVIELTPEWVTNIHEFGGTVLGSSRGPQSEEDIVDALERMNINILFMIGGDGTMKAASKINEEITKRKLKISVIGVPKTIDNDINFVSVTFGFDTAVDKATEAIRCAHTEAVCHPDGIGMVKLMGRESGFIAAQSALALNEANFVLVPEVPFDMHGEKGILRALERRLDEAGHAVVVVAEGAGQRHCKLSGQTDASGNPRLGDICAILKDEIKKFFADKGRDYTLKYIDPSYIIRSVPANSTDRVYCNFLGHNAVHAAMTGKTAAVVSQWFGNFVNIPFNLVTRGRKKIDVQSNFWRSVLEATGQHRYFNGENGKDKK